MREVEGQSILSNKLRFVEGSKKYKTSEVQIDTTHNELITVANNHKLIIVGSPNRKIEAIQSNQLVDGQQTSQPQASFTTSITFSPTILTVSRYGYSSLLMVAGRSESLNCPVLEFFDIDTWTSLAKLELNDLTGSSVVDYSWHPVYYESIVTLCCDTGHLLVVALNKQEKRAALVYCSQKYGSQTCCWSPKGKQVAIGLSDGSFQRLEPAIDGSNYNLNEVANSKVTFQHPRLKPQHRLIKMRWINKTNIMLAHAVLNDPNGPDTIYTLAPINPAKPYKFWTDLCVESAVSNYQVQMLNLMNYVICSSNASSEVAIIGVPGQGGASPTDVKLWDALVIDEEGMRIEFPLDEDNRVSCSRGAAATVTKDTQKPDDQFVFFFYTSSGVICPYIAVNPDRTLHMPEMQELEACPLVVPHKLASSSPGRPQAPVQATQLTPSSLNISRRTSQQPASTTTPLTATAAHGPVAEKPAQTVKSSSPRQVVVPINFHDFSTEIANIKKGLEFNKVYLSLLEETNRYRKQFEEIQDIHKIHFEALEAIKGDIDALDIGMLENLYLIEYIKSRSKGVTRKKSLDPLTLKKVEAMKQKSRAIAEKLKDLNMCVDVSWEDFVRRRNAMSHKDRRLNSLDTIYKALATNQKLITLLKSKASHLIRLPAPAAAKSAQSQCEFVARRELEPTQLRSLKEFLASRSTVPVRRPEPLAGKTSSRLQSH